MQHADWGERCRRWAGIRSEVAVVQGTAVHLLRADAARDAPPDAPTHLLIHPMAAGASMWLDAIGPLTAHGPVIAPDLPGSVVGHTASPHRSAPRAELGARFVRALTTTLGLDRLVVHGWSFGGLVAVLFADLAPRRVQGLVLVDPALPGPLRTTERVGWQTAGRLAMLVGVPVTRALLGVLGPRVVAYKQRCLADPHGWPGSRWDVAGGDPTRLSPELTALLTEQVAELRMRPERLDAGVTAMASAISMMFIDRRPAMQALRRVAAPTLLLWGDDDPLIERPVIDGLVGLRPDWHLRIFEGVGHLLPMEVPDAYATAVGDWVAPS